MLLKIFVILLMLLKPFVSLMSLKIFVILLMSLKIFVIVLMLDVIEDLCYIRERPFNLKGGGGYGFFLKKYSDSQCY